VGALPRLIAAIALAASISTVASPQFIQGTTLSQPWPLTQYPGAPLPAPSKPGNTIIAGVIWWSGIDVVSDSEGNSYQLVANGSGAGNNIRLFYAHDIDAGSTPITVYAVQFVEMHVLEYSGLLPGASFEAFALGSGSGATVFGVGPLNASDAGDLLVGFGLNLAGISGAEPGMTIRTLDPGFTAVAERIVPVFGAATAGMSAPSPGDWGMVAATFAASPVDADAGDGGGISPAPPEKPLAVGCECSHASFAPILALVLLGVMASLRRRNRPR